MLHMQEAGEEAVAVWEETSVKSPLIKYVCLLNHKEFICQTASKENTQLYAMLRQLVPRLTQRDPVNINSLSSSDLGLDSVSVFCSLTLVHDQIAALHEGLHHQQNMFKWFINKMITLIEAWTLVLLRPVATLSGSFDGESTDPTRHYGDGRSVYGNAGSGTVKVVLLLKQETVSFFKPDTLDLWLLNISSGLRLTLSL